MFRRAAEGPPINPPEIRRGEERESDDGLTQPPCLLGCMQATQQQNAFACFVATIPYQRDTAGADYRLNS